MSDDIGFSGSMDRKWFYFTSSDKLMRVPIDGGEETVVIEPVVRASFAEVDHGIYFVRASENDSHSLHFYDFGPETTRFVGNLGADCAWPGVFVSPDERTFLYMRRMSSEADLMLVENFR